MPRRPSSSSKSIAPAPRPSTSVKPFQSSAAPTQYQGPSFGQAVKDGIAYGVGSSIAHNVIGRMFSAPAYTPRESQPTPATKPTEACGVERNCFENCLLREGSGFCGREQDDFTACIKLSHSQ